MNKETIAALLQKHLEGKTQGEELRQVEDWYEQLDADRHLSAEHKLMIRDQMLARLKAATQQKRNSQRLYSPLMQIAAATVLILSAALFFWQQHASHTAGPTMCMLSTSAHERKELILSDGSKINLGPSSQLWYPSKFADTRRKVLLRTGEAFFSIAHEEKRRFCVQLKSGYEVAVLGTSFRISNLEKEQQFKVTVATGKVAVKKGAMSLATLTRGQELEVHKRSGKSALHTSQALAIVNISFQGHTMREVIRKLEYLYDIRIALRDPKCLKLKTTGEFNTAQEPAEILDIICRLHHLGFSSSPDHKFFKIYPFTTKSKK